MKKKDWDLKKKKPMYATRWPRLAVEAWLSKHDFIFTTAIYQDTEKHSLACCDLFQSNTLVEITPITKSFLPGLAHVFTRSTLWQSRFGSQRPPMGHTSKSDQGQDRTINDILPHLFTAIPFRALFSVGNMTPRLPWHFRWFLVLHTMSLPPSTPVDL